MITPTRYKELGYRRDGIYLWRIYDITTPRREAAIGPLYRTKAELLADLDRFGAAFGAEGASKQPDGCSGLVQDAAGTYHCPHCCEGYVNDDGDFVVTDDVDEEEAS